MLESLYRRGNGPKRLQHSRKGQCSHPLSLPPPEVRGGQDPSKVLTKKASVDAGPGQQGSGLAFQIESGPRQMSSENISLQPVGRQVWCAGSVTIFLQEQCKDSELFPQVLLSPGRRGGCLPANLAGGFILCIPSNASSASFSL